MVINRFVLLSLMVAVGAGQPVSQEEERRSEKPAVGCEGVLKPGMTLDAAMAMLNHYGAEDISGDIGYYSLKLKWTGTMAKSLVLSSDAGPVEVEEAVTLPFTKRYFQMWNGNVIRTAASKEKKEAAFVVEGIEVCDDPIRLSDKEEKWFPVERLDLKALPRPSWGYRASHRR